MCVSKGDVWMKSVVARVHDVSRTLDTIGGGVMKFAKRIFDFQRFGITTDDHGHERNRTDPASKGAAGSVRLFHLRAECRRAFLRILHHITAAFAVSACGWNRRPAFALVAIRSSQPVSPAIRLRATRRTARF